MEDAPPRTRWLTETGATRGQAYAARFRELAASGADIHGEARLLASLAAPGTRVLDAGCGTGRVAVELDRRGYAVTGVDLDTSMLDEARAAAPGLDWRVADLAGLELERRYDVALLAGNVMVYLTPGTEAAVVARVAGHLLPGGLLVAGFTLAAGVLPLVAYDAACAVAGLALRERWATWDRAPYAGGDYAVSVHAAGALAAARPDAVTVDRHAR